MLLCLFLFYSDIMKSVLGKLVHLFSRLNSGVLYQIFSVSKHFDFACMYSIKMLTASRLPAAGNLTCKMSNVGSLMVSHGNF